MSAFDLEAYLASRRALVEEALRSQVERLADAPPRLKQAIAYSLLAPGKRLRPILVLAACEAVGGRPEDALDAACALELVHTYSLIHDDLPAMDDDDFRRGRPSCHRQFGEALAILAGDALLTEAFRVLVERRAGRAAEVADVVFEVARAAGAGGMVGGQVMDIESTGQPVDIATLEQLHGKKTGALFLAALRAGARLGGAGADALEQLTAYGRALGLAFQIIDDVLDVSADLETLGKDPESDRQAGKTTFVDLLGEAEARARADAVMADGIKALEPFGARADALRAIGRYVVTRRS